MPKRQGPLGEDSVASIYIHSWGRERARTRSYSGAGVRELWALRKARSLGHTVGYHVDSEYETFASCTDCAMMGSMTNDDGVSGRIFERDCGDYGDEERWESGQSHDPYLYSIG